MDKVLSSLIEGVTSGNILVIAVIVAVAIIFNLEKIFGFVDARKKVKIQLIEESLTNSHVSEKTKEHLENLIETEYFKSATGIYLEKEVREALIKAHLQTNGELKFKHFKRSIPYLKYKNSVLSVNIGIMSKLAFLYNSVFGFLSIITGLVFFMLPALSDDMSMTKIIPIYGVALFLSCFGGLMLIQSFPVISARRVRALLEKIDQK